MAGILDPLGLMKPGSSLRKISDPLGLFNAIDGGGQQPQSPMGMGAQQNQAPVQFAPQQVGSGVSFSNDQYANSPISPTGYKVGGGGGG